MGLLFLILVIVGVVLLLFLLLALRLLLHLNHFLLLRLLLYHHPFLLLLLHHLLFLLLPLIFPVSTSRVYISFSLRVNLVVLARWTRLSSPAQRPSDSSLHSPSAQENAASPGSFSSFLLLIRVSISLYVSRSPFLLVRFFL